MDHEFLQEMFLVKLCGGAKKELKEMGLRSKKPKARGQEARLENITDSLSFSLENCRITFSWIIFFLTWFRFFIFQSIILKFSIFQHARH